MPPKPTWGGPEGFGPGPDPVTLNEDPAYTGPAGMDATRHWNKEGVSVNFPSDQDDQYTHIDAMSDVSVPSPLSAISSTTPDFAQYQEQLASRDRDMPQQFQETDSDTSNPATPSSQSSQQPADTRGAAKGEYTCHICLKIYSQKQGVRRHQREKHNASLCMHCYSFEYGRPYRYKEHLRKYHPDVNIDKALADAARTYRETTMSSKRLSQRRVLPTTPQRGRQSRAGSHPLPPLAPTLPTLAVAKVPPVTPPRQRDGGPRMEAENPNGTGVKAGELRPLQQKMGVVFPGCVIHYRRRSRGFGVAKEAPPRLL